MALEKDTPFNRNQILKMTVAEVHMNLIYLNRRGAVDRKYSELK